MLFLTKIYEHIININFLFINIIKIINFKITHSQNIF